MTNRAAVGLSLTIWAALAGAFACHRADDSGRPASVPPLPSSDQPAPAPAPPAAAPSAAAPPPAAPAAPAAADDTGATISGTIVLRPAKTKPHGTLFLVARRLSDNPSARGTLIAVKKLPATTFPLAFSLGAADMPFQNGPFDGELSLTARIDQDGDPLTHEKGDVFGTLPKVTVGARDVVLALDQIQKETESLAGGPMGGPMMGGGAGPTGDPGRLPPGHP